MGIELLFATTPSYQVGLVGNMSNYGLPWSHNEIDMKHFKSKIEGAHVVMGRTTYELVPPFVGTIKHVLTSKPDDFDYSYDTFFWGSIEELLGHLINIETSKPIYVIGGAKVLEQFAKYATKAHVTIIHEKTMFKTVGIDRNVLSRFKNIKHHGTFESNKGIKTEFIELY